MNFSASTTNGYLQSRPAILSMHKQRELRNHTVTLTVARDMTVNSPSWTHQSRETEEISRSLNAFTRQSDP